MTIAELAQVTGKSEDEVRSEQAGYRAMHPSELECHFEWHRAAIIYNGQMFCSAFAKKYRHDPRMWLAAAKYHAREFFGLN